MLTIEEAELPPRRRQIRVPGDRGQEHAESGAAIGIALRPDAAAVLHDDGAADGEPQSGSTLLPGIRGVDLLEAVEDRFQLVLGNAAAVVSVR